MNRKIDPHREPRPDYKCEIERDNDGNEILGCDSEGYCTDSFR